MRKSLTFTLIYIISIRSVLVPLMACMLPAMSDSLLIPRNKVQFVLSALFIGMLIAKTVGVLGFTNKTGNRKALLFTLPISAIGVLFCFIPIYIFLIFGCVLQGLGIGIIKSVCADLARTGKDKSYAKKWVKLSQIPLWMPVLITLISGWILHYLPWQYNLVLALILIIPACFFVFTFIPETEIQIKSEEHLNTLDLMKELFKNPVFLCYSLIFSLFVSMQAIFYTTAPFIFIKDMGYSYKHFPLFVLVFISGAFLGLRLNSLLERYLQHKTIILLSCCIASVSSILLLIIDLMNLLNMFSVIFTFFLFALSMTLINPSIRNYISEKYKKYVVVTTAFIAAVVSLAACLLSASSAYLVRKDIENLSYLFCVITFFALTAGTVAYFKYGKK